jgi:antitoxin YobK
MPDQVSFRNDPALNSSFKSYRRSCWITNSKDFRLQEVEMSWQNNFEEAKLLIESSPDAADFTGGASSDEIQRAESLLGLNFPLAYKEFLETFGCGNYSDAEFFGLIPGNVPADSAPCAIWFTQSERGHRDFPRDFVVIYASSFGPLYCLATEEAAEGDCPIREWSYKKVERNSGDFFSHSFSEFFLSKIKER